MPNNDLYNTLMTRVAGRGQASSRIPTGVGGQEAPEQTQNSDGGNPFASAETRPEGAPAWAGGPQYRTADPPGFANRTASEDTNSADSTPAWTGGPTTRTAPPPGWAMRPAGVGVPPMDNTTPSILPIRPTRTSMSPDRQMFIDNLLAMARGRRPY